MSFQYLPLITAWSNSKEYSKYSLQYISAWAIINSKLDCSELPQKLQNYLDTIRCLAIWGRFTDLLPFWFICDDGICKCAVQMKRFCTTRRSKAFYDSTHNQQIYEFPIHHTIEENLRRFDLMSFTYDFSENGANPAYHKIVFKPASNVKDA